jgi:hypothetical protein
MPFQVLITYSLTEFLNASDALMAPVRLGVVKPGVIVLRSIGSSDPLDFMEKSLYSENEYFTASLKSESKRKVQ